MSTESTMTERIKKLLRLSKSPNQHEAELALSMAFEIAARHQIDIESIDLDDDLRRIVQESMSVGYRFSLSKKLALMVVKTYFNVNPVISYPNVLFIGTGPDIAIARHVFHYLTATYDRICAGYKSRMGRRFTATRRRSYTQGFFYGVGAKLKQNTVTLELENNQYGLIVRREEQRRQEFEEATLNIVSVPLRKEGRRDNSWLMQGYRDGKAVEMNTPIAPKAPAQIEGGA